MADAICSRCGDPTPHCYMQPHRDWCKSCHTFDDVDRHTPVDSKKIPNAKRVEKKLLDKIGVECPHCDYRVLRGQHYFSKARQLERCPKCLCHYYVQKGKAK